MNLLTDKVLILNNTCGFLSDDLYNVMQDVFLAIRIAVPILIVVLIIMDMTKAVTAGNEDEIKKATGGAFKRVIVGVVIFLLPSLINMILGLIGNASGTCGIG